MRSSFRMSKSSERSPPVTASLAPMQNGVEERVGGPRPTQAQQGLGSPGARLHGSPMKRQLPRGPAAREGRRHSLQVGQQSRLAIASVEYGCCYVWNNQTTAASTLLSECAVAGGRYFSSRPFFIGSLALVRWSRNVSKHRFSPFRPPRGSRMDGQTQDKLIDWWVHTW